MRNLHASLLALALLAACTSGKVAQPSGDDSGVSDAGSSTDAGTSDAGVTDSGIADAGMSDAGMSDAGTTDAGMSDAGTTDAGTTDAGTADAGVPDPLAALDPTGETLPDTDYPYPSDAVFMAPSGDDANPGTQAQPVRTLTRAIALVPSGGTVVARGGLYRDGSTKSVYKVFTLQAFPHEQPWFDGTDVVTGWQSDESGHWWVDWDTPSFCGGHYYDHAYDAQTSTGPCAYYDEYGDPANPAAADPQLVFLDGVYVHEVTQLAETTGDAFFYDQANKRLYLGTDPTGRTVELAARPTALVLQGGAGGNAVRGVGFTRFATNEFSGNATHGAVLGNSPNLTFEKDAFTRNAGAGLFLADPRGGYVHLNVFAFNGANGLDANGHQHSGSTPDDLVVDANVLHANNQERFGPGCGYSCSAAGSKMAHMNGFTLSNNLFEDGVVAKGYWCDLACNRGVMVRNVFRNNGDTGLMYEVSDTGIIASNLLYGNGRYGLKVSAANTRIYNNTLVDNAQGALLYDDDRTASADLTDVGPDTANLDFSNNLVVGPKGVQAWRTSGTAPNTGPDTFFSGLDFNGYFRADPGTLFDWRDGTSTAFGTCAALETAKGWEGSCLDEVGGSDPFFVDAAAHDYRVRPDSAAAGSGMPLPADVAEAIGLPAGQPVDRGALAWPGR